MKKLLFGLIGLIMSGGLAWAGSASSDTEMSSDLARRAGQFSNGLLKGQLPDVANFLEDNDDSFIVEFIQNNWTLIAGGLAAYFAAPEPLKGVAGLGALGLAAFNMDLGSATRAMGSVSGRVSARSGSDYSRTFARRTNYIPNTSGIRTLNSSFTQSMPSVSNHHGMSAVPMGQHAKFDVTYANFKETLPLPAAKEVSVNALTDVDKLLELSIPDGHEEALLHIYGKRRQTAGRVADKLNGIDPEVSVATSAGFVMEGFEAGNTADPEITEDRPEHENV